MVHTTPLMRIANYHFADVLDDGTEGQPLAASFNRSVDVTINGSSATVMVAASADNSTIMVDSHMYITEV